ncbi:hypothetical protein AU374_05356 [Cupriavidus metallidurans]|nr:hypothetical protein AU374_05356 [Cupriavidus metallidurans]
MSTVETKWCRDCDTIKPASEFYANRQNKDGLATYCKPCAKARACASQAKDPEGTKEAKRTRWARFAEANPEEVKLRELRQRSAAKGLPEPDLTVEDLRTLRGNRCPCCRAIYGPSNRASIDRIEPAKGYTRGNVAYICEECNLLKGTKTAQELVEAARQREDTGMGKGSVWNYVALAIYTKHHAKLIPHDA